MCTGVDRFGVGTDAFRAAMRREDPERIMWPLLHRRVMDESRIWGALGVLLAIVGLVAIAPEVLHAMGGEMEDGLGATMLVGYGVGVAFAALLTVVVILPNIARSSN